MPNTYYAFIDKVEPAGSNLYMEFHCMYESDALRLISFAGLEFNGAVLQLPDEVIVLINTLQAISTIFSNNENIAELESSWCILRTNEEGLEAESFRDDDPPGILVTVRVTSITMFEQDDTILKLLKKKFSFEEYEDAPEQDIKDLLNTGRTKNDAEFVAVYDVGHGNCNAFCNANGHPLLYYDLGGGCYKNKMTYPAVLKFCNTFSPAVILSHWDTDHYQSAMMDTTLKTRDWIIPRQQVSKTHLRFFLSLTGKRYIFPPGKPISFCWGTILLCNGPLSKKNHCGLAIDVKLSPSVNNINEVLLAADAAYQYIPLPATKLWNAMVATHHGAEFPTANSPVAGKSGKGAIAYSYGFGNSYHHPRLPAVRAHNQAGWLLVNTRRTRHGHIALADAAVVIVQSCIGKSCDLVIVQQY